MKITYLVRKGSVSNKRGSPLNETNPQPELQSLLNTSQVRPQKSSLLPPLPVKIENELKSPELMKRKLIHDASVGADFQSTSRSFSTLLEDSKSVLDSKYIMNQLQQSQLRQESEPMLDVTANRNTENKLLRLKISDYFMHPYFQIIFIKIWKISLSLQYTRSYEDRADVTQIPLNLEIYENVFRLFTKALGYYYNSDYYRAKVNEYTKNVVFFDRFCFDFVSLFGQNLLHITQNEFEHIVREVFKTITFYYEGELRLKKIEDIESPWKFEILEQELMKSQEQEKNVLIKSSETEIANYFRSIGSKIEEQNQQQDAIDSLGDILKFGNILEKKKEEEERRLQKQKKVEELSKLRPFTMHKNREDVQKVLKQNEAKNYRKKYDQPSHFNTSPRRDLSVPKKRNAKLSLDQNSLISHSNQSPYNHGSSVKSSKASIGGSPKLKPTNNFQRAMSKAIGRKGDKWRQTQPYYFKSPRMDGQIVNALPEKARFLQRAGEHSAELVQQRKRSNDASKGAAGSQDSSISRPILLSKEELMKNDALYHKFEFFDNFCIMDPKEGAETQEEMSQAEKLEKFFQFEEINNRTKQIYEGSFKAMPRFSDLQSLNKTVTPKPNFEKIKLRCMQETNVGVPINQKFKREQERLATALQETSSASTKLPIPRKTSYPTSLVDSQFRTSKTKLLSAGNSTSMSYLGGVNRAAGNALTSAGKKTEASTFGTSANESSEGPRGRSLIRDHRKLQNAQLNEASSSFLMNVLLKGEDFIEEQKSIDETSAHGSKDITPDQSKYRSFHKSSRRVPGNAYHTTSVLQIDTQKARNAMKKLENAIHINEYARTAYSMKSRASDITEEGLELNPIYAHGSPQQMPPLAQEEASVDSPLQKLALDVDNSQKIDVKKLSTDLKDPRFRRKMMEIRSFVGRDKQSTDYGSQRRKAEVSGGGASARRQISLTKVDLGKNKLKSAGASILERVEPAHGKEYAKSIVGGGDSSMIEFSSIRALQKKGMKGQSNSMILKDLDRRKQGPHKATISCLQYHDFQLEDWRSAYQSKQAAIRHFLTGSSYFNVNHQR